MKAYKSIMIFSSIFIFILTLNLKSQSSFAVVKPNGTTTVATTMKAALDQAATGDIIYLPSGNLDFSGLKIDKSVHIIGAGYCPDSSNGNITHINGEFTLMPGASGGSLTGIATLANFYVGDNQTTNGLQNFLFSRCWFASKSRAFFISYGQSADNFNAKNITFSECIFDCWWAHFNYVKFLNFDKCVFVWARLHYISGDATFTNCNFLHNDPNWPTFNSVSGAIFKNCIFAQVSGVNTSNVNTFTNNLFLSPTKAADLPGQIATNNVFNFDSSKVYKGGATSAWPNLVGAMSLKNIFQLTAAGKAAITGTDGKEVGIYGGANPFKEGALPPIPAIRDAKVSTRSNAKGKLEIEFKIQAQTK